MRMYFLTLQKVTTINKNAQNNRKEIGISLKQRIKSQ